MTGFLGAISLILSAVVFGYAKVREHQSNSEKGTQLPPIGGKFLAPVFVLAGIGLLCFSSIVFYSEPGMSYLVQYPNGTQTAVLKPGYATKWFGDVIPFKKFTTVAFLPQAEVDGKKNVSFSAVATPQNIRFNDSVKSTVSMTARFELSNDPEKFLKMAVAFRNQENLIHSSLIPIMQESMNNTGRMFSAQEYIGGKGGDFDNAVLDQIRHGIYLLDIKEENNMEDKVDVTDPTRQVQQGQTIRVVVSRRMHENGTPLRKDEERHPLTRFGIQLLQANIRGLDHDPKFKENLEHQREAAAQVAIERQKARQQEERKKRIIAEGEAEKAQKKIELEMAQIQVVIAAETESKKAEQEQHRRMTDANTQMKEAEVSRQQKVIELATAKLEAESILALARADAEKRKLLMSADNALSLRLEAYVKVQEAYARALQGKQLVPTVVIGGRDGNSTNATALVDLLTAKTARELAVELNANKPKSTPATGR